MTARRSTCATSRREFLQYGGAIAALAAAPLARAGDTRARAPSAAHPLFSVVVDRTYDASTAFAAEAARRGAAVRMTGADIGGVWMNEIEPRWRKSRAAIAGLTGAAPLFCLELMARDYGMRVVYRVEHSVHADGRTVHTVSGPAAAPAWAAALSAAGSQWSTVAAALATTCPADLRPRADTPLLDLALRPSPPRPTLFSWVIAPYARSRIAA